MRLRFRWLYSESLSQPKPCSSMRTETRPEDWRAGSETRISCISGLLLHGCGVQAAPTTSRRPMTCIRTRPDRGLQWNFTFETIDGRLSLPIIFALLLPIGPEGVETTMDSAFRLSVAIPVHNEERFCQSY